MWERLFRKLEKTQLLSPQAIKVGVLSAQTGPLANYGSTAVQGLKLGGITTAVHRRNGQATRTN